MKTTTRLLTLTSLVLFLAASPTRLIAADCADQPVADEKTVLRQIELKIAIAQYERLRASLYDAQLEATLTSIRGDKDEPSPEEKKQSSRASIKAKILEEMCANLRQQIREGVNEAYEEQKTRAAQGAAKGEKPK